MAAVLAVLQFIGILLLVLLGLALLLLSCVLFVPVHYRLLFQFKERQQVAISVSWLLKMVVLRRDFAEQEFQLYILGIPAQNIKGFFSFFLKKEEKDEEERVVAPEESKVHMVDEFYRKPEQSQGKIEADDMDESTKDAQDSKKRKKKKKEPKKSFSFERISSIITFIRDEKNKLGFGKIRKELGGVLRYLMPDTVKGNVIFGTGDPCTTGWALGVISWFPLAYTEGLKIVPDFEEKILKADGLLKGKLRVFYFVKLLARGYLDDDIKQLVMKIMDVI